MYHFIRKCTDPQNVMTIIISIWLARWVSPSFQTHLQKVIGPYQETIETILHLVTPVVISLGAIGFVVYIIGAWLSGAEHPVLQKIESRIDATTWEINGRNLTASGFSWAIIMISASYVLGMNDFFVFIMQIVSPDELSLSNLFRYILITAPFIMTTIIFFWTLPLKWGATYNTPVRITNHRLEVTGELKGEKRVKIAK